MNLLLFLQYVLFNKDNKCEVVLAEYKKHFNELQEKRWSNYNQRMN